MPEHHVFAGQYRRLDLATIISGVVAPSLLHRQEDIFVLWGRTHFSVTFFCSSTARLLCTGGAAETW